MVNCISNGSETHLTEGVVVTKIVNLFDRCATGARPTAAVVGDSFLVVAEKLQVGWIVLVCNDGNG